VANLVEIEWTNDKYKDDKNYNDLILDFHSIDVHIKDSLKGINKEIVGFRAGVDGDCAYHWSRKFEWPWAILKADLKWRDRVFDAGGGLTVFQYVLSKCCHDVINLDQEETSLRAVRLVQEQFGMGKSIRTMQGDLCDIPFRNGYFDKTFCISVVEHIPNWRQAVMELFRVTASGGTLILTMDINHNPKTGDDCMLSANDLGCLLDAVKAPVPTRVNADVCKAKDGANISCVCMKFIV